MKGPTIYLWPEEDNVRAYHYDARTKFKTKALKGMMGNKGMPGGFLSVSANGQDDGILWAAIPYQDDAWVEIVRGTLRAFDANTLQLLWSSDGNEPADNFDFAKYVPPTVANGKVYLPTFSDRLNVYGLHAPNAAARPKPRVESLEGPAASRSRQRRQRARRARQELRWSRSITLGTARCLRALLKFLELCDSHLPSGKTCPDLQFSSTFYVPGQRAEVLSVRCSILDTSP